MLSGQSVSLPMWRCKVQEGLAYGECGDYPMPHSQIFLYERVFRPRLNGMSYLLSPRYTSEDGMAFMKQITYSTLDIQVIGLALAGESDMMVEQRWIIPDCPLPNPAECTTDSTFMYKFSYPERGTFPNSSEWGSTISSVMGPLVVSVHQGGEIVEYKFIPPFLRKFIRDTNQFERRSNIPGFDGEEPIKPLSQKEIDDFRLF